MKYAFRNKLFILSAYVIDFIGYAIFLPFKIFRKNLPRDPKNILIIRLDHIGDTIYSTVLAQNLKVSFPKAKVTFLTSACGKELLMNNPYIDEIIFYEADWFNRKKNTKLGVKSLFRLIKSLRKYNFDLGLDPRGDLRHIILMVLAGIKFKTGFGITGGGFLLDQEAKYHKGAHALIHNLELLRSIGIKTPCSAPELFAGQAIKDEIEAFLKKNGGLDTDRLVIIHSKSENPAKNWPDIRFAKLAGMLYNKYRLKIILVGSPEDRIYNGNIIAAAKIPIINASGKISLLGILELCKKANLFIGVDSGPSHIAALSGVPTLILYSATNKPQEWAPLGKNINIIQTDVPCKNCGQRACATMKCMDLITIEEVMQRVKEAIQA